MSETGRVHCVKSVQIRSYLRSVFSCIQSECKKMRTKNNYVFGHFSGSGANQFWFGNMNMWIFQIFLVALFWGMLRGPRQASMMKIFVKVVNRWLFLLKRSIIDIQQEPKCASLSVSLSLSLSLLLKHNS